ncbi:hypothetical protein CFBP8129_02750 [Xanthomonas hortorum pv. gardneri]|uniref:Uncharacterized protein n=1 Tax=Xanthomonas hortorum pv. gardneri TaxID=2754056 RepID=A0A6V7BG41_9XANT|nr:hypothetical protein CFBP8129_02750 [Xanthomonas hortorum pv. gardneri]CAD0301252.1 hypothetical protein CFBP8129_02750 [Xanthomonas hortorum pv. gardneri]CAD0301274.1 hypothetical protein CFBP2044_02800 [Xanthomonas hortorum pv. cynarae]CAD0301281.1 hypothetical protein CFBP2044_02800 [Xanthomonas hortorum pv. cynarae]
MTRHAALAMQRCGAGFALNFLPNVRLAPIVYIRLPNLRR